MSIFMDIRDIELFLKLAYSLHLGGMSHVGKVIYMELPCIRLLALISDSREMTMYILFHLGGSEYIQLLYLG